MAEGNVGKRAKLQNKRQVIRHISFAYIFAPSAVCKPLYPRIYAVSAVAADGTMAPPAPVELRHTGSLQRPTGNQSLEGQERLQQLGS